MLVAFFSGVGEIRYVRQSVHEESQERSVSIGLIMSMAMDTSENLIFSLF